MGNTKNALTAIAEMLEKQHKKQEENRKIFEKAMKEYTFPPSVAEIISLVNDRNSYMHKGLFPLSNNSAEDMKFCASMIKETDKRIQILLK
jgi:hypothetical protein